MKLLIVFALITSCLHSESKIKLQDKTIELVYAAQSRGFYKEIIINKEKIVSSDKKNSSKKCSEEQWQKLMSYLNSIELVLINSLEAPTSKRLYDGAAIASLKIKINDKTYLSSSFDHGHPPKELEDIVKHIISLAESID